MRISDWSSDVCSSDLVGRVARAKGWHRGRRRGLIRLRIQRLVVRQRGVAAAVFDDDQRRGDGLGEDGGRGQQPDGGYEDGVVPGVVAWRVGTGKPGRSEEHTSELQDLMSHASAA